MSKKRLKLWANGIKSTVVDPAALLLAWGSVILGLTAVVVSAVTVELWNPGMISRWQYYCRLSAKTGPALGEARKWGGKEDGLQPNEWSKP